MSSALLAIVAMRLTVLYLGEFSMFTQKWKDMGILWAQ